MRKLMQYMPLDKSWIIRMGILDMLNKRDDILEFLSRQDNLGDDLMSLKDIVGVWGTNKPLDVGESGTLYRVVRFALWKNGNERELIRRGTLKNRSICNDSSIVKWPVLKLLKLDNGTSQWASASVLNGRLERIDSPPYKLELTYSAVDHWRQQRKRGMCWSAMYDRTIERQAEAYSVLCETGRLIFKPLHSEDYCFARAYDLITPEEGMKKWSSLVGHETNRIEEMEQAIEEAKTGKISSKDHRVIQALVMKHRNKVEVVHKDAVSKSWPQFWQFIEAV